MNFPSQVIYYLVYFSKIDQGLYALYTNNNAIYFHGNTVYIPMIIYMGQLYPYNAVYTYCNIHLC